MYDFEELKELGKIIYKSGMFKLANEAQGFVIAKICAEENISLLHFQRSYHVINGIITMRADRLLAYFVERGGEYKINELNDRECEIVFIWKGKKWTANYTLEDARRAKLLGKDSYQKHPREMLFANCIRQIRKFAPEISAGIYVPEEFKKEEEVKEKEEVKEDIEYERQKREKVTTNNNALNSDYTDNKGIIWSKGTKFNDINTDTLIELRAKTEKNLQKYLDRDEGDKYKKIYTNINKAIEVRKETKKERLNEIESLSSFDDLIELASQRKLPKYKFEKVINRMLSLINNGSYNEAIIKSVISFLTEPEIYRKLKKKKQDAVNDIIEKFENKKTKNREWSHKNES